MADWSATADWSASTDWYLTVRCTNPACAGLIAFQKSRFRDGNPDLRVVAIGELSVDCPHCRRLVRFQPEQIERRRIVLTQ